VKKEEISKEDEAKLKNYLQALEEERSAVESTIGIIEDQYREALISETTYKEISDMAKSKLENIKSLGEEINKVINEGKIEKVKLNELYEKLKSIKLTKE